MSSADSRFVMRLSCPDRVGVVSNVTTALSRHRANILEAHHFRDTLANRSVMRLVFEPEPEQSLDIAAIEARFGELGEQLQMTWVIHEAAKRPRVLIAVSNFGHCLNSLLHRWSVGTLPIDVVGVVSNHESQRRMVEGHGLPFFHFPIESGRKEAQEARMLALFDELGAELLVLARYMQILTAQACRQLAGRAINIHHSFLPGFKGARPYTQAYERGVKLIGATAHYVNEVLDEGPIIEQAVERVDHSMTPDQLATIGNEIESVVLNRAVQWHAEHRVFEFGNRTVVLR